MKSISIHTEYITLGQALKLADCIDSGGHAKPFLLEHDVLVNGQPEQRRGRKLYDQDVFSIEHFGEFIICAHRAHDD